jgi:class 3 adenylate cyclase/pimeloyl-ACP methyl ester carboxylesterase
METPAVQFCTSADGTRIAFMAAGNGPPLLVQLSWATNMELDWQDPECRLWMERMAGGRRLICCGRRGVGPSQRSVTDLSLDAQVSDLHAVADHLQIERCDMFGSYEAASVVASYAAAHPKRVSRLVLWAPIAKGSDTATPASLTSLANLMRTNWPFARRAWADLCFPSDKSGRGRWFADLIRQSVEPEMAARYLEFTRDVDVMPMLTQLAAPVLVFMRSGIRYFPASAVRAVAAALPHARLISLEDDVGHPPLGDTSYVDILARFLDEERSERAPVHVPSGTAIILFADIADSTALTERLGDATFRERARELDTKLRAAITERNGTPIEGKLLGDGVLATFASAKDAIEGALAFEAAGEACGLGLHVGLHAGDVIREENNVFGGAVNVASRISALAAPGEVLVSDIVRGLARTSAGVSFEDRGEHDLKGVSDPVRVFAVRKGA